MRKKGNALFKRTVSLVMSLIFVLTLFPAVMPKSAAAGLNSLEGSGSADDPYKIQSKANWDTLADYVADGNDCENLFFKMTADIGTSTDPVTKTMGVQTTSNDASSRKRFAGTFDGGSKTLYVNLTSAGANKNYTAPFAYVKNVTIQNLTIAGTITTNGQFAGGLIGSSGNDTSDGVSTIINCHIKIGRAHV